jgi:hypothetical protein
LFNTFAPEKHEKDNSVTGPGRSPQLDAVHLRCSAVFYLYQNSITDGREACQGFESWYTVPGNGSLSNRGRYWLRVVEAQRVSIGLITVVLLLHLFR